MKNYSEINDYVITKGNQLVWNNSSFRPEGFPLDYYSVFSSYTDLSVYVNRTDKNVAYEGQIVVATVDGKQKAYILDTSMSATGLSASLRPLADNTTVDEIEQELANTKKELCSQISVKVYVGREYSSGSMNGKYTDLSVLKVSEDVYADYLDKGRVSGDLSDVVIVVSSDNINAFGQYIHDLVMSGTNQYAGNAATDTYVNHVSSDIKEYTDGEYLHLSGGDITGNLSVNNYVHTDMIKSENGMVLSVITRLIFKSVSSYWQLSVNDSSGVPKLDILSVGVV